MPVRQFPGEGTFGVVYRVWNASTGATCADNTPKHPSTAHSALQKEVEVMRAVDDVSTADIM